MRHTRSTSLFLTLLTSLFFVACGGSSEHKEPQLLLQAPLTFAHSSPEVLFDDPAINTLSGGSGTGSTTYTSSDTEVVSVDANTGVLTINTVGSATVTAVKASDDEYASAQASYTITVLKAEQTELTFGAESVTVYIDETPEENPVSGGSGTGALVYTSSDESIASVDAETGGVSILDEGRAVITATKEKDENYESASTQYTLTVLKYEQEELVFEYSAIEGATTTVASENPLSGGSGEGQLSYASSNSDVASVDSLTGEVSLLTPGTAVITAHKAKDGLYFETSASYDVEAYEVVGGLVVALGKDDAEIEWDSQVGNIEVIRSQDHNCNVDNYPGCLNSRLHTISQPQHTPFTDSYPTLDRVAHIVFQNSDYRSLPTPLEADVAPFASRTHHALASYNDRLWVFGGRHYNGVDENGVADNTFFGDVWSSPDGVNWVLETDTADFGPRAGHDVLEFNGKLYLFSGWQPAEEGNGSFRAVDIWSSDNGVDWERLPVTVSGSDSVRMSWGSQVVIFDGKLWMTSVSGLYEDVKNPVWSSSDGSHWNLETENAPFGPRNLVTFYANDEYLFVLGGDGAPFDRTPKSDVWRSADGINWELVSENGGYEEAYPTYGVMGKSTRVMRYGELFYLMGGGSDTQNIYSTSTDGIHWTQPTGSSELQFGQHAFAVEYQDALWLVSGESDFMWRSVEGINWRVPVDVSGLQWETRE